MPINLPLPIPLSDYTPLLSLPVENSITDIASTLEKLLKGLVVEPHPALFFLGQHLWLRLFGNGEAAMRSIGVLYSFGAIFSNYQLVSYQYTKNRQLIVNWWKALMAH